VYTHLKERQYYEDIIDRVTTESGRRNYASFENFRKKYQEIASDQPPGSFRNTLHLNWFYMIMVGNELVERYDKRESEIQEMMARDQAKDEQVASARLTHEPVCEHCGKTGLRIISKDLMHRGEDYKYDDPEEVLFMLRCPHCNKNSAYWEDGSMWEHRVTRCPKCKTIMTEKNTRHDNVITTIYTCPSCSHSHKTELNLKSKVEKLDPEYEKDRYIFCLHDKKMLDEHRDAKWRLDGLIKMGKEFKEKEENKHIYDAMKELKKPRIAELSAILAPTLEKAGYIEFSLDKPEMGRDVTIGFNCLDSKSGRDDYDSEKTLKKTVEKALDDTNWRLMSDGIHYRLGYLNGRLRAYEQEEDLKKLVMKSKKLKDKQKSSDATAKGSARVVKDRKGRDIIL
jgi:hypothetical protein